MRQDKYHIYIYIDYSYNIHRHTHIPPGISYSHHRKSKIEKILNKARGIKNKNKLTKEHLYL